MSLMIDGVTKEFVSGGRTVSAVTDFSLDIASGEFYTLLGPSGCGKTTLLRMIAGFEQPTRGAIVHNGRIINDVPPYARGFPMVFQSYALFPHMSVGENVGYGLKVRRVPRRERTERVGRALALLELGPYRDRRPAQLSGGQQQRVALARALVLEPEIILLDEPLSNLDAGLRVAMRGEIRALQKRLRITALYVTHDQEEALAISDRIVVMNRGRIEQVGAPADVYERPHTGFVARFMGSANVLPFARTAPGRITLLGQSCTIAPAPDATHVVLRSEAIALDPRAGAQRAIIDEVTFLGSRVQYVLNTADGTRLVVDRSATEQPRYAASDAVWLDILPERLHFVSDVVRSDALRTSF